MRFTGEWVVSQHLGVIMWLIGVLFVIFVLGLINNIQKAKEGRIVYAADWFATIGGTLAFGWALIGH